MPPQEGVPSMHSVGDVISPELSPLGKTNYPFSRQQLNKLTKMLRDCNIEEFTKLPKIVLIGNQSSGKSSLIEAISKIKVPRAAGTCTRCPMEVMLSSDTEIPWQAKVSLRLSHEDGRSAASTIPFAETVTEELSGAWSGHNDALRRRRDRVRDNEPELITRELEKAGLQNISERSGEAPARDSIPPLKARSAEPGTT